VAEENILEMIDITKEFSGVKALDQVNFSVRKGHIHALVGENGAGKSTLMKILGGIYPQNAYSGRILLSGEEKKFHKPKDSEEAGISLIHQELALINEVSVAENLFLGRWNAKGGIVDWKSMNEKTSEMLKRLNLDIDVREKVKYLGVGQQQLVEIARALSLNGKILILDEPTSALTDTEIEKLFAVLRDLKEHGITLIYISHRLQEIFSLADRVTVLRDGKIVTTDDISNLNQNKMVSLMIGRELVSMYPTNKIEPGEELLMVENYSIPDPNDNSRMKVKNVNLNVRAGEIVGISGLLGSGRTELVSAIYGSYKKKSKGKVYIKGSLVNITNPKKAIKNGLAFLTEDRKQSGLILITSVIRNISLASLKRVSNLCVLKKDVENSLAVDLSKELRIKLTSVKTNVANLSGGNQQKVVLAKWLATQPIVLILDEPTRGVDVGAKSEIYFIMKALAAKGVGILMVSSDLPEIIGMSDRVYVMHEGEITGELKKEELTEERIMQYAVKS